MRDIAPMIAGLGFFTMVGWIVYVIVEGRRRRERLKVFTEFHTRLLDRIGSAKEFGEFLQTDGGVKFLDSLSVEPSRPAERIIRAMQVGVVLLALGVALLILGRVFAYDAEGFIVSGAIFFALGIGFLLSTATSYYLSRKMGLVDGRTMERGTPELR